MTKIVSPALERTPAWLLTPLEPVAVILIWPPSAKGFVLPLKVSVAVLLAGLKVTVNATGASVPLVVTAYTW